MAKGFTVKAKTPTKKKAPVTPQYDYAKAKEMIKGKTVVFCLPGRGVSYTFLKSFVCHYVLIWYNQEQVYRYHKIIHRW